MTRARIELTAALLVTAGCTPSEAPGGCDRDCLIDLGATYVEALAAGDPGAAPLADEIAFVENVTRMSPGEGLWAAARGVATPFRLYVPDPAQGTIGLMAVIERETAGGVAPAQLAARLRIADREIVEAEHLVADVPDAEHLGRLEQPRPNLTASVPPGERMTRDALAAIAGAYYDSLDLSDGSLAPFAADCERQENGMITAGPGLAPESFASVDVNGRSPPPVARDCVGQMSSRRFAYIDSIDNRRVFAIDSESGLAMGLSHFRQSMRRGPHRMVAADGSEVMWDEEREPYDLPAAHVFKITGGEIHEVEAIGVFVPYGSPTGWE